LEVIGNPNFIAGMVNLITAAYIMHPSLAQHNIKALDIIDHKFCLIDN